jgi:hypothetical protein
MNLPTGPDPDRPPDVLFTTTTLALTRYGHENVPPTGH